MNPKLNLIARKVERREQAPAPVAEASGLGNAIESLIAQQVAERVEAALAEQRRQLEASRPPAPRYDSFAQIPPTPRAATRKPLEATIQRDGAGLARAVVINGVRYLAQRDAAGQLVRMVSEDKVAEVSYNGLPPVPADINRPRKLYGNEAV